MLFLDMLLQKRNPINSVINALPKLLLLFILCMLLFSCGSKKPRVITTKKQAQKEGVYKSPPAVVKNTKSKKDKSYSKTETKNTNTYDEVIKYARSFKGTRYKYGGSSKSGMDCSGLIHVSFNKAGTTVPRTSRSLKDASRKISLKNVQKGDLLFFATRSKNKINHVGLVTKVTPAEITFIHATTSKGVIESTLNEIYWVNAFINAGRLN